MNKYIISFKQQWNSGQTLKQVSLAIMSTQWSRTVLEFEAQDKTNLIKA